MSQILSRREDTQAFKSPILIGLVCTLIAAAAVILLARVPAVERALASGRFTALGATLGLGLSIAALLIGALVPRGASAANAVKFCSLTLLIVSLGLLVGACNGGGGQKTINTPTETVKVVPNTASLTTAESLTVDITVTLSLGPNNPGPVASGTVTLTSGTYNSSPQPLTNGADSIVFPASALAVGSDTLTVTYTPATAIEDNWTTATGTATVTVTAPALVTPTVTVTPSLSSITTSQALSVSVAVGGGSGNPTPTGSVTLTNGSYNSGATALTNGSTTISVPAGSLATGTDTLTAAYAPDSNSSSTYNSAMGTATVTVTSATVPTYTITGTVTGLASGTELTITDSDNSTPSANDGTATVNGDGSTAVDFTLYNSLASGTPYNVTLTPPTGQTCAFSPSGSGSGTISADVSLSVTCSAAVSTVPLNGPSGMVFDSQNHLFVANSNGNQVLEYSEQLGSGNMVTGLTLINTITAGINNPSRLAFDAAGNLYVANYGNNTVTVYGGPHLAQFTTGTISSGIATPLGIAVDQDGNVYVGNNSKNSIAVFSGSPPSGFSLANTYSEDGNGDQFLAPGVITFAVVGSEDDLFIGTGPGGSANEILSYSVGVGPLGISSDPIGAVTNSGCSDGPSGPTGIAVSSISTTTTVYVTNYYAGNVAAYSLASIVNGGFIPQCPTPSETSGTNSGISSPEGVAVDSYGNVFVANSGNSTITVYNPITDPPIYTQH
ncbi:MAG: hypothetical protein ABR976_06915 [Terracidiphilus sp.]|jgi:6-phosphogluconolactonase (cycloisomerase 2 family)